MTRNFLAGLTCGVLLTLITNTVPKASAFGGDELGIVAQSLQQIAKHVANIDGKMTHPPKCVPAASPAVLPPATPLAQPPIQQE
jgi:hypothetical protein